MSNKYSTMGLWFYCAFSFFLVIASVTEVKGKQTSRPEYWALQNPSKAHYKIECSINTAEGLLEGTEIIRFKNVTSEPMSRFEIRWVPGGNMEITSRDKEVKISAETNGQPQSSLTPIEFSEPILPGEIAELEIKFHIADPEYKDIDKITTSWWLPHLWRGFETHGDYEVKLSVPEEYTVATSGLLNKKTGYYHAEDVRSFGLFLGKDFDSIEADAGDVRVRCIFAPNGKKCAELLLKTAVDAINYYRERFGFYTSKCLTIIPGMNRPAGGYPLATNIVVVHGMEQLDSMPKYHWQWITAHEIGHQYGGEHILSKDPADSFNWLMISLGIYADREYTQARNLSPAKHRGLMDRYIKGVRAGLDTTINITPEQRSKIQFDFNNVVKHGKSYSVISALDCVLGNETFSRIYQRCLKEFAGRRLGISEFQNICEEESGEDLSWFFDQWVNSNKILSYEISSQKSDKLGSRYKSEIEVKCLGNLKMPVPVAAYFEDGSSQIKFTNRLPDTDVLEFESSSPLKEVRLDPAKELAMVIPPPSSDSKVLGEALPLPWSGAGEKAFALFKQAKQFQADSEVWFKLGLNLYDGRYYPEALESFQRIVTAPNKAIEGEFVSLVWQGHILDILKQREKALECYHKALDLCSDTSLNGFTMRHDQWGMVINREWVEQRIEKPFIREGSKEDEAKQTAGNLEVLGVEFGPIHQGKDNTVSVKVNNTSSLEQTFGIHIQTKCPKYRGRFSGWGRSFFDVIKSNETKDIPFEFEIFGPITNATWIRLQFYNPTSADEYDFEKWFKKIMYTSEDFKRFGVVEEPLKTASKKQNKLITQLFRKMQNDIRNEKHQEVWQLLTNDYQQGEFSNNFETFVEVMSLYKVKFLALEPNSITARNEVLTLTAISKFLTLVIEFVQIEKQWKIKWMRATAEGDWKERVLPKMEKRITKHFDIYYLKDSTAEKDIEQLVKQKEKGFTEICQFLGKDSDVRICMVFFEDGKTKKIETGHQGTGWAYGHTIVEIYNEKEKLDPYHETVHILMGSQGNPPALFNEGFATYMSERLGARGLEYLGGGQSTIYERIRELESKNELINLKELLGYTEIGSGKTRPPVAYPEAASFVKFLIDSYGKEKFLQAYKQLLNSDSKQVQERNIEKLTNIYGKSLNELKKQWLDTFMKSQSQ